MDREPGRYGVGAGTRGETAGGVGPASSTYRVQLHAGFDFRAAAGIVDYLADLGVTHLYCSPYLQAAAGSTHGYDVVDPRRLNDELGGSPAHAVLLGALREARLGQVLDVVPNHMAADADNPWWWDVLENGRAGRAAAVFDIDWEGGDEQASFSVLVPILGDHYGRVLEAGDLHLARVGGELVLRYHEHRLPISPRSIDDLVLAAARRAGSAGLAELGDGFAALPHARFADASAVAERHRRKLELAGALAQLCEEDPAVAEAIDTEIAAVAADPDRLDALLRRQNYRLAHWRTASEELDYRRFFNIESLVGVRVEDPEVFSQTHELILRLVADGTLDGLRIDHIDGLRDPEAYLRHLAGAAGGVWTVVEKILAPGEDLPAAWPVAGTSGYEFVFRLDQLFVDAGAEAAMTATYADLTGEPDAFTDVVVAAKHQVMREELRTEVDRLTVLLAAITDADRRHRDHTRRELRDALREVVAHFGVYRTYVAEGHEADGHERAVVAEAVARTIAARPDVDVELVEFIGRLVLGGDRTPDQLELALRFQQLTAPVTAKGVEDTAFYRYHRLVALNEVGGHPGVFGRPVATFHEETAATAIRWPETMLTLSTHDTKRSADVRARILVLSEVADAWAAAAGRWAEHNDRHRTDGWPDRNTEYLLYQTLVGAWPLTPDRAVAYLAKATREAKVHTSWVTANAAYDAAVERFTRAVLADPVFVADLERFLADCRIVARGRRTSLAQVAMLLTCPGVADVYQGTELWDLSLVDPDNRRPVDYGQRRRLLARTATATAEEVLVDAETGAPKQWLLARLLRHRRDNPDVFAAPGYEPLVTSGTRADDVVAFARPGLAVAVPRHGDDDWAGTTVDLPAGEWRSLLTGVGHRGGPVATGELFAGFPVAVLAREP